MPAPSRSSAAPMRECASGSGPPGAGQLTKMVNQICIAGLVQGLSGGHPLRQEDAASTLPP